MARPEKCAACGRSFRPTGTSSVEYPGTMAYSGSPRCSSCRQARREVEEAPKVVPAPVHLLTPDEVAVAALVARHVPAAERDEITAMLGVAA